MILTLSVLVVSNHSPKSVVEEPRQPAKFVIASWDYPDEYGQGIYMLRFYENSTGSWVAAPWYYVGGELDGLPFYSLHPYDSYTLNWSAGVAMKLRVYSTFNNTVIGADDEADGQNYQRHDVSVTSAGVAVFNQSNFTYYDVTPDGDYWAYEYEVVLNFLPVVGEIYTVVVTYEVYWPTGYYEPIELADYGEDQNENYDPNYVKTQTLDNDAFEEVGIDIEIWFDIDVEIGGFSYASYLYASSQDDCNIGFYNFNTSSFDNFEEPLPTSYDWMNGTVTNSNYWNETHIGCQLSEVGIGDANFYWDYAELTLLKPRWNLINSVMLYFSVPFDMWGMDMALIILGLVMIPVSTLYLAYGIKHDRSSDRLFYGLIILMLGFGLFIGGILP